MSAFRCKTPLAFTSTRITARPKATEMLYILHHINNSLRLCYSMSGVEVAAPYAILAVKYLFNVAKKWWDGRKEKKEIKENESRVERLMKEVEDLKRQLEEKGRENINDDDVNQVNQQWSEVRNLEGVIKEDAASAKAFYNWVGSQVGNEAMDVEELGEFYRLRLAQFIDKSRKDLSKWKLEDYKELLSMIEVNIESVRKARYMAKRIGGPSTKEEARLAEYHLRLCLKDADEALRTA